MSTSYEQMTSTTEDLHPVVRMRSSSWLTQPDGEVIHFSGYRCATIRQAIELEASSGHSRRPSSSMDTRTFVQKLREWFRMLLRNPVDALVLLRINRHPPMISWEYDDSCDWPGKRWRRALALHKGEDWSSRKLIIVPVLANKAEGFGRTIHPEVPLEIPRFLLKNQLARVEDSSSSLLPDTHLPP